jgi:hypothetical protein
LDTDERRLVHDIASIYDLKHKSEGEGNQRFIKITKKCDSAESRLVCEASAYTIPESEIVSHILEEPAQTINNESVPKSKGRPVGSTNKKTYERLERELRPRKM